MHSYCFFQVFSKIRNLHKIFLESSENVIAAGISDKTFLDRSFPSTKLSNPIGKRRRSVYIAYAGHGPLSEIGSIRSACIRHGSPMHCTRYHTLSRTTVIARIGSGLPTQPPPFSRPIRVFLARSMTFFS